MSVGLAMKQNSIKYSTCHFLGYNEVLKSFKTIEDNDLQPVDIFGWVNI